MEKVIATPVRNKILFLHGYTQNAEVFRKRTAVIRKQLEPLFECKYIDAPHKVQPQTDVEGSYNLTQPMNERGGDRVWTRMELRHILAPMCLWSFSMPNGLQEDISGSLASLRALAYQTCLQLKRILIPLSL